MVSQQWTKQTNFDRFGVGTANIIIREKICAGVRSQLPVINNPCPPTLQLGCISTIEKDWGVLIGVEFV
jgi:hypothetical protein